MAVDSRPLDYNVAYLRWDIDFNTKAEIWLNFNHLCVFFLTSLSGIIEFLLDMTY